MVAEDLNHTVWRTFCTAQPYRSQRATPPASGHCPVPEVYEEQRLDVSWFQAVRQRNGRGCIDSGRCIRIPQCAPSWPRARLVVLVMTLSVRQRVAVRGPRVAWCVCWTCLACPWFCVILPFGCRISGPGVPGEPYPVTACHEILLCGRSRASRASLWDDDLSGVSEERCTVLEYPTCM